MYNKPSKFHLEESISIQRVKHTRSEFSLHGLGLIEQYKRNIQKNLIQLTSKVCTLFLQHCLTIFENNVYQDKLASNEAS